MMSEEAQSVSAVQYKQLEIQMLQDFQTTPDLPKILSTVFSEDISQKGFSHQDSLAFYFIGFFYSSWFFPNGQKWIDSNDSALFLYAKEYCAYIHIYGPEHNIEDGKRFDLFIIGDNIEEDLINFDRHEIESKLSSIFKEPMIISNFLIKCITWKKDEDRKLKIDIRLRPLFSNDHSSNRLRYTTLTWSYMSSQHIARTISAHHQRQDDFIVSNKLISMIYHLIDASNEFMTIIPEFNGNPYLAQVLLGAGPLLKKFFNVKLYPKFYGIPKVRKWIRDITIVQGNIPIGLIDFHANDKTTWKRPLRHFGTTQLSPNLKLDIFCLDIIEGDRIYQRRYARQFNLDVYNLKNVVEISLFDELENGAKSRETHLTKHSEYISEVLMAGLLGMKFETLSSIAAILEQEMIMAKHLHLQSENQVLETYEDNNLKSISYKYEIYTNLKKNLVAIHIINVPPKVDLGIFKNMLKTRIAQTIKSERVTVSNHFVIFDTVCPLEHLSTQDNLGELGHIVMWPNSFEQKYIILSQHKFLKSPINDTDDDIISTPYTFRWRSVASAKSLIYKVRDYILSKYVSDTRYKLGRKVQVVIPNENHNKESIDRLQDLSIYTFEETQLHEAEMKITTNDATVNMVTLLSENKESTEAIFCNKID